ncbi:MAG: hypothetical protein F9K34_13030 [Albidovulum sp.]|uniref:hypothetical protein n=1 Tax=Albidovulum sp. TaxID=1872424 RepID=UPI0013237F9F|nr:hypothetical protein [Defluviimonas sp.]KAB2883005.1 MAG: hypothetical protein F9K34_13030 [Defluviimonas sp.]
MRQEAVAGRDHPSRAGAKGRPGGRPVLLAAALLALSACTRNQYVVTECVDGRPVVERTLDVAPPNC